MKRTAMMRKKPKAVGLPMTSELHSERFTSLLFIIFGRRLC